MEPIVKIKKEMEFNKSLGSLIEVMKTIAVMQYHTLEKKMSTYDDFLKVVEDMFAVCMGVKVSHPFVNPADKKIGVIAITSDAGLLGGLNNQIVRAAVNEYAASPGKLVIVGMKGQESMRGYDVPFVTFPGINDEERYPQALQLRDFVVEGVQKGTFGPLKVIYPFAESFVIQKVKVLDLLPFSDFPKIDETQLSLNQERIFESSIGQIIEYLISLLVGQRIYEILGWSRLAELAARYTHLESSSQKIEELNDKLKLRYHKVRHQLIDRTMCEIFAARSIYGKK